MAIEEHVEILRRGVETWNGWREEHPDVRPELSGADLRYANLRFVNLTRAKLIGAHLSEADLSYAKLNGADLSKADLSRTHLRGTELRGADLIDANLRGADLSYAKLSKANFRGVDFRHAILSHAVVFAAGLIDAYLSEANLTHANLAYAKLNGTVFAHVDLRQVKGLDSLRHGGPSTIGTNTLERSRGQIPRAFLKGSGLTDWQIEDARLFDPELDTEQRTAIMYEMERIRSEQAIHWFRVFISYTREDAPFVEALEKIFDEKGVRYWRDVHDLKAGRLERQIDRAIDLNPLVLLVLSERSVESDWVEWEAAKARKLERRYRQAGNPRDVLCPVCLDDAWKSCAWPDRLRRQIAEYNILDFSGWEGSKEMAKAFAKLYEGVILNYRPEGEEAR